MIGQGSKIRSSVTYSYVYKHEVFSPDELKQVLEYCDTLDTQQGIVSKQGGFGVGEVRKSNIAFIEPNETNAWMFDRINYELSVINAQFYGFDLYGYDYMQYGTYSPGGRYGWHMDMFLGDKMLNENTMSPRKLSASILLNDDFEGGEFQLNEGEGDPTTAEMRAGTMVAFPSFMVHRVNEVTSGTRKSLVAWVTGPKFK